MNVKIVVGLIMVAVLMIIFPIVMNATHDLQTDAYTQAENITITDAPDGTGTMVCDIEVWNDDVASVTSVTATGQTLSASAYAAATETLTISGFSANTSYITTAVYEYDALTDYTGMGALVAITPLLIWIAVLATVLGGIYFAVKGRG